MTETKKTETEALAEIVRKTGAGVLNVHDQSDLTGPMGAPLLILPDGVKATSAKAYLDEWLETPRARTGVAVMQTLQSFIDHANRFKDTDSAIFADRDAKSPKLTAVLDYHHAGADSDPRFGRHRTRYYFPCSEEWLAWKAQNGKPMSQTDFAEFLETRIVDICLPEQAGEAATQYADAIGCTFGSPQKLLELSRGLSVRVGTTVKNVVNLATGEAQVNFATDHSSEFGGSLKVPGAFIIAIPVFRAGDRFQIAVRLRYRIREGAVTWFYELARADVVFDLAFDEACNEARQKTALPLFVGSPE